MAEVEPDTINKDLKSAPQKDQHNPEALLFENAEIPTTTRIKTTDVRVVASHPQRYSLNLFNWFVFFAIVFSGGYYCYQLLQQPDQLATKPEQYVSQRIAIPVRQPIKSIAVIPVDPEITSTSDVVSDEIISNESIVVATETNALSDAPLYTVVAGPFVNTVNVNNAITTLRKLGFEPYRSQGRGSVTMVRLLEGSYGMTAAKSRLAILKKTVKTAFMMPNGEKIAIYVGSFQQHERAKKYQAKLANEGIDVDLVTTDVVMNGTTLVVLQADQQTASEVLALIMERGINVVMEKIK